MITRDRWHLNLVSNGKMYMSGMCSWSLIFAVICHFPQHTKKNEISWSSGDIGHTQAHIGGISLFCKPLPCAEEWVSSLGGCRGDYRMCLSPLVTRRWSVWCCGSWSWSETWGWTWLVPLALGERGCPANGATASLPLNAPEMVGVESGYCTQSTQIWCGD